MQLVKLEKAVKPKPTKSEIIGALAQLRYQKALKEHKEKSEHARALSDSLRNEVIIFVKGNTHKLVTTIGLGYANDGASGRTPVNMNLAFCLDAKVLPNHLLKKFIEAQDARDSVPRIPSLEKITAEIKSQVSSLNASSDRIDALLDNPVSRKVLEDTLTQLEAPKSAKKQ